MEEVLENALMNLQAIKGIVAAFFLVEVISNSNMKSATIVCH